MRRGALLERVVDERELVQTAARSLEVRRVRVERDGRTIGHLGPGDFLGESACLRSQPHTATYVTETPVELLAFPARSLWHLLDRVPELARRMLVSLSEQRD